MKTSYRIKINNKGSSVIWDYPLTKEELLNQLIKRFPGYKIEVIE